MGNHNHEFEPSGIDNIGINFLNRDAVQLIRHGIYILTKDRGKLDGGSLEKQIFEDICKEATLIEEHCKNIENLEIEFPHE